MHMLSKATIEALWCDFDVPMNDHEESLESFCGWPVFTDREEIWRWFDEQYARWGGVHALMFPDEHPEANDGLDPREYVVGTFEPCDVEERVEPAVLEYIKANGLMDEIVLRAVECLRDAYDWDFGDEVCECLRSALVDEIGREKLEELES